MDGWMDGWIDSDFNRHSAKTEICLKFRTIPDQKRMGKNYIKIIKKNLECRSTVMHVKSTTHCRKRCVT
jgi:hypothetical protein